MRRFSFLVLGLIPFVFSCGNSKEIPKSESEIIFSYRQTSCFGKCPVYNIEIYSDGLVKYEGKHHVSKKGNYIKHLSDEKIEEMIDLFLASKFFDFEDEYTSPITDLPTKYLGFTYDGKSKTIKDYHGSPAELKALHKVMQAIVEEKAGWKAVNVPEK